MEHFKSPIDLYRQMAANIPDCSIYIFDKNFDYLLAEGEEIAKLGLDPQAFAGSNFFEIWPHEITSELGPYYQQTLEGKRQKIEKQLEGAFIIQHFVPILGENQKVLAGMVVSQNISELKDTQSRLSETELELKQNQVLFEAVVNSIGEGIIVADKAGKILLKNPASENILKSSLSVHSLRDLEKNLLIKRHPQGKELDPAELPLSIAFEGGKVDGFVTYNETRNKDHKFYVESSARPIHLGKDNNPAAVIVMRDISHRKELDEIVEDRLLSLQNQVDRFKKMLSILAHNMRGPSANLSILLSLLEKSRDEEERALFLSKINEVSGELQKSTASLGAAISAYAENEDEWVHNNFVELLDRFKQECEDLIRTSGIEIQADFSEAPGIIYPTSYLKSIFFNIMRDLIMVDSQSGNSKPLVIKSYLVKQKVELHISSDQIATRLLKYLTSSGELRSERDTHKVGYAIAKNQLHLMGSAVEIKDSEKIVITF